MLPQLPAAVRVLPCTRPTDMRNSLGALCAMSVIKPSDSTGVIIRAASAISRSINAHQATFDPASACYLKHCSCALPSCFSEFNALYCASAGFCNLAAQ
jgi:hypothetical protein